MSDIVALPPEKVFGRFSYGKVKIIGLGGEFKFGDFVSIADDVTILLNPQHLSDHVTTSPLTSMFFGAIATQEHGGDVIIGNDVWLGYRATIIGGVTIGDGAVIGACSMVVQDVPPYAIVSGVPARVLRYRFRQDQIDALMKIKWWNWEDKKIQKYAFMLCSDKIDEFIRMAQDEGD